VGGVLLVLQGANGELPENPDRYYPMDARERVLWGVKERKRILFSCSEPEEEQEEICLFVDNPVVMLVV